MELLVSSNLAEELLRWRNEPSDGTLSMIGKRAVTGFVALPLLFTVNFSGNGDSGFFVVTYPFYACFSEGADFSYHLSILKEGIRNTPLFVAEFFDNFYTSSLDKDTGLLMNAYFKAAY